MATATQVTIKVVVDGTQAGPAIDQINTGLAEIGVKGTASLGQAGAAADNLGRHVSTSLDGVRLMSQEFGFRMPRALENMASRIPGVSSAIGAMMGAFAGIAVAEILYRIGDAIYNLYEKYLSVNAVQEKFLDEFKKAQNTDFVNSRSIEDTTLRIGEATTAMRVFNNVAEEGSKRAWQDIFSHLGSPAGIGAGIAELHIAHSDATAGATAGTQMLQLTPKQIEQQHELNNLKIEGDHATDGELTSQGKITAELEKQKALHAETRNFNKKMDQAMGNPVSHDAGEQEETLQDRIDAGKASAERVTLQRAESEAIMHSRHEALEANLSGEDLYHQKMLDDTEELRLKLTNAGKAAEIPTAVEAVNAKYFADMSQRAVDLQNKTALAVERATVDAMPDESFDQKRAKVTAGMNLSFNEINTNATLGPDEASAQRVAAVAKANAEIAKLYDEQDMKEGEDMNRAAEEHARILDEETAYAMRASEAERRIKQTGLNGWVSDYTNAIAAIEAQDKAETQKLDKLRADQGMSDAEYAQAKVNIDRTANAEIQQQNQEMAHQIANTLSEAFTNPIDFIKRKMQQMFMDILANALMQSKAFQSIFGAAASNVQGAPGAAQGGILGHIGGAIRGTFPGHPSSPGASASGSAVAPALSTGSISTVTSSGFASAPAIHPAGGGSAIGGAGGSAAFRGNYVGSPSVGAGSDMSAIATDVPGLYRRVAGAHASSAGDQTAAASPTISAGAPGAVSAPAATSGPQDIGAHGGIGGATSDPYDVPQMSNVNISGNGAPVDSSAAADATTPNIANGLPGNSGNTKGVGGGISSGGGATGAGASAVTKAMPFVGAAYGGYAAVGDTMSDFKSGTAGGTLKGMLGDAGAGAAIGSVIPGVGTLIGAGIGAAVGLVAGVTGAIMGEGGKLAARDYYKKSIFPAIEQDRNDYDGGDFQTAISDVNRRASEGMDYMGSHWGTGAANWVNQNYLLKEQKLAVGEIEDRAKGGSYAVSMSAKQFHAGGPIGDFGDLSTSPTEGFIHAMLGETIVNPTAAAAHGPALDAMNAGASPDQIGGMYRRPGETSSQPSSQLHVHIHTLDSKTTDSWMRNGGAQTIAKHLNDFNGQYAGDGISG